MRESKWAVGEAAWYSGKLVHHLSGNSQVPHLQAWVGSMQEIIEHIQDPDLLMRKAEFIAVIP